MTIRDRAFFATSALLYMGPLFAGLSGQGFDTLPVFSAVFMLWLNVVRPGDWPRLRSEPLTPRALAWLMLLLVGQMAVVAFCLVIGRGIGGLFGFTPAIPFVFTVLVSMLAVGAARLLHSAETPTTPAETDGSLQIGSGILDMPSAGRPAETDRGALVAAVVQGVAGLPAAGATKAEIAPYTDFVERSGLVDLTVQHLLEADARHLPHVQLLAALAFRPAALPRLVAEDRLAEVVNRCLSTRVAPLVQQMAIDLRKLLPVVPGLAAQIPAAIRLRSVAAEFEPREPFVARALRALADDLSEAKVA